MKPTDFAYHLTNYLSKYLPTQVGVSANTIKSYRDTFSLFLRYCKSEKNLSPEHLKISDISKDIVENFLIWLELDRNCSVSTRNQRLSAIHAFFKYLQYECPDNLESLQKVLSIPLKRNSKKNFDYLTLEGVKSILSQPDQSNRNGFRDLALLTLMYDSGARVQEMADLTNTNLRLDSPASVKLIGKGQKTRIVPLMSQTAEVLLKYQKCVMDDKRPYDFPLFFSRRKEKLTRSGISFILAKYADMARKQTPNLIPDKVTPHTLRHSKAMHLLQSGVNLIYIRDLLGHSDVKTTEIYARADTNIKRNALINANHPEIQLETPIWQKNSDFLSWLQGLGK